MLRAHDLVDLLAGVRRPGPLGWLGYSTEADLLQHRLHLDWDVSIALTALCDMADAGPGEVVSNDRDLLARHHVDDA
jgi:hypothetical protein